MSPSYRAFAYPPSAIARITDWDLKLDRLTDAIGRDRIKILGGIPTWILVLFDRLAQCYGGRPLQELDLLVHGGASWAPYAKRFESYLKASGAAAREVHAASEGSIAFADSAPEDGLLLAFDDDIIFEFVPIEELNVDRPTRHWVKTIETGVN